MDDYTGHDLVFLVGSPRSGTTWLQRLLASHPKIQTGPETHLFPRHIGPSLKGWQQSLASTRPNYTGAGLHRYYGEEAFHAALRRHIRELLAPPLDALEADMWFLEKTPGHALYVAEIHRLLPDAKILHLLRDGRDVVASLLHLSRRPRSWAPRSSWKAAKLWVRHVERARQAAATLPEGRFFEVRYEDLTGDAAPVLARIAAFLGLVWPAEQIDAAIEENRAEKIRAGGGTRIAAPQETDPRFTIPGVVHRARPGGWRTDLTLAQKLLVWARTRRTMDDAGYPW